MNNIMNVNHLQYFQTLAKTRNFSTAAERCYTTQPNLSYGIKALEKELGIKLIERGGRYAELTQVGELYLPYVERALSELQQGKAVVTGWNLESSKTLNIGGTRLQYFSDAISRLMRNEKASGFHMNAYSYSFKEAERCVLEGILEIGTGYWEPESQRSALVYIPLKLPDLILVVDEYHPLAEYSSVSLAQIQEYPILTKKEGSTVREIQALYKKANVFLNAKDNAPTLMVVLGLVESRMGIALINDTRTVDAFKVKKIRIDWPKQDFLYSLFFRKDRPLSSAAQLISTYIIGENDVTPEESMKILHKYSLCSSQTIE